MSVLVQRRMGPNFSTGLRSNAIPFRRRYWTAFGLAWTVAAVLGLGKQTGDAHVAGAFGAPPPLWPEASSLPRQPDLCTFVMFLHPRCPCSRASLEELSRLLVSSSHRARYHVVLVRPRGVGARWESGALRSQVDALTGTETHIDDGGTEAERFGARTSGMTYLYDASGQLLFAGGLTPSRGHVGDNAGRAALDALLKSRAPAPCSTRVYGCALQGPAPVEARGVRQCLSNL